MEGGELGMVNCEWSIVNCELAIVNCQLKSGGEGGIRTHGSACGTTRDFQSRSFGRSDTSPD